MKDEHMIRWSVDELVRAPHHAGPVRGAARVGEAAGEGRLVQIGIFPDGRARFRATTCATLIAFAETACEALEAGVPPGALDAAAICARVTGVHPAHRSRATLVAAAVAAAFPQEQP
jgi:hypothetical protein